MYKSQLNSSNANKNSVNCYVLGITWKQGKVRGFYVSRNVSEFCNKTGFVRVNIQVTSTQQFQQKQNSVNFLKTEIFTLDIVEHNT